MMQLYALQDEDAYPQMHLPENSPAQETPEALHQLLQEFSEVFTDPTSLPPFRDGFDHQIPLKVRRVPILSMQGHIGIPSSKRMSLSN